MQNKVHVLVRSYEAMQEKSTIASYSEPIQILTLVPDIWSPYIVQNILISLTNLFELHMKSKM